MRQTLLVMSVFALSACPRTNSSSVSTRGMYPDFAVVAAGDGTAKATLSFKQSGLSLNKVQIDSTTDTLTVQANDGAKTKVSEDPIAVQYSATLSGVDQGGTVFTVELQRVGNQSAASNKCTLPNAMTVVAPSGSFSRATQDVAIGYGAASTDSIVWDAVGSNSCIKSITDQTAADTGTLTIPHASIVATSGKETDPNCVVTVTIRRVRNGTVDPNFDTGGKFVCSQLRTTTFTSKP